METFSLVLLTHRRGFGTEAPGGLFTNFACRRPDGLLAVYIPRRPGGISGGRSV